MGLVPLACRVDVYHEAVAQRDEGRLHLANMRAVIEVDQPLHRSAYRKFGTFHETAKVVNNLFGETWRVTEFGSINCQLEFERCRYLLMICCHGHTSSNR